jgi:hypothetical protein
VSSPTQKRREKQAKRRAEKQHQARARSPTIDDPWGVSIVRTRTASLKGRAREIHIAGLPGLVRPQ